MRIIRNLDELSTPLANAVLTIGNFDGVHLGHREVFRRVVRRARECGGTSTVFTFSPHPLKLLAPAKAPRLINTDAEKEVLIEASCIDVLICVPFTREIADLSASDFVQEVLVGKIGVRHLVVGHDYAFGMGREGDVQFLRRQGAALGFGVEVLDPVAGGGIVYSSTRIRRQILKGEVAGMVDLLGRHFNLEGTVVHGDKRGTRLGFPTANLKTDKELLPRPGVYAVKVRLGDEVLDAVANIGCNPTFRSDGLSLEVHILDFHRQIYAQSMRVYFIERLRDERRFPGVQALAAAIAADIERARPILERTTIVEFRDYLDCGVKVRSEE